MTLVISDLHYEANYLSAENLDSSALGLGQLAMCALDLTCGDACHDS